MTGIPHLDIPDILVEEDDEGLIGGAAPHSPVGLSSPISPTDGDQHRSWFGGADLSLHDTSWAHPLSVPRAAPPTTTSHHATPSAFSFELQESDTYDQPDQQQQQYPSAGNRQSTEPSPGTASANQVRGMLDDSVWVESIRRSASLRRPGQPRYGD